MPINSGRLLLKLVVKSRAALLPLLLASGLLHCGDSAVIVLEQAPPAPLLPGAGPAADPSLGGSGGSDPAAPDGNDDPSKTPGEGNPDDPPLDGPPGTDDPGDGTGGGPISNGPCQPRASGGPFWLTEQESVQITLECGTGEVLPGEAFELVSPPPNVTYDPAARVVTFAPGLDQAGVYALGVRVAGSEDSGNIEVQVADRFGARGNVPVNPATYTKEFGLPVMHLTVDPAIGDEEYLPASITYRGKAYAGAEAKLRGNTSLRYPKKSFTLKFAKEDKFEDPLSAAGFTGKRKVTLTTSFDDSSCLRARLAFELWNRIGAEHVQVQSFSTVLYLNGEFWGLYTIIDHIDKNLMEDNGFFEDGNLYKARTHDANFRLTRAEEPEVAKVSLSEGFTKEEGTPLPDEPGANADLEGLVSWVASASSPEFIAQLGSRLATREYEDWWLLVSLIQAGDSVGKNSYHYRDPRVGAPDGRFHVVPWDFNESFGQTFYADRRGREATVEVEDLAGYNYLFQRFLSEPSLRGPLVARYRTALDNEWEIGSVLASFDAWATEIEAVAERDESKWSASVAEYYAGERADFPTFAQEITYMRQWLVERWSFVRDYY
jgi:spore coat protein H